MGNYRVRRSNGRSADLRIREDTKAWDPVVLSSKRRARNAEKAWFGVNDSSVWSSQCNGHISFFSVNVAGDVDHAIAQIVAENVGSIHGDKRSEGQYLKIAFLPYSERDQTGVPIPAVGRRWLAAFTRLISV